MTGVEDQGAAIVQGAGLVSFSTEGLSGGPGGLGLLDEHPPARGSIPQADEPHLPHTLPSFPQPHPGHTQRTGPGWVFPPSPDIPHSGPLTQGAGGGEGWGAGLCA